MIERELHRPVDALEPPAEGDWQCVCAEAGDDE